MNSINATRHAAPIDRDIPDLAGGKKKSNMTKLAVAGAMLVGLIIAVAGVAMFMNQLEKNKREAVAEKKKSRPKEQASAVARTDFHQAQARIRKQEAAEEAAAATVAASASGATPASAHAAIANNMTVPADAIGVTPTGVGAAGGYGQNQGSGQAYRGTAASGGSGAPARIQTRTERELDGDVLVAAGSGDRSGGIGDDGSRRIDGNSPGADAPRQPLTSAPRKGLDEQVKTSDLKAGRAALHPDFSMLLQGGTAIPCPIITRIVSERPGATFCVVSEDVYSADGSTVLVEKGSKVRGERREAMMDGEARIGVVWSRIDTPYKVFADVNSLATDSLGATGIAAGVDNHLSARFGGAVLLSLIGDFGQAAANRANNSGGTIQFSNTATAGQDLALKTLEHTINIPPTGYVNQGAMNTILVLRDIDFRGVYELARK